MRPRLLAAVLSLCASFVVLAQKQYDSISQLTPPPPKQPPATARITGTVFCNDTHRPARGAMVMALRIPDAGPIQPDIGPMSRVATDGTYTLGHLRSGNYTVIALLPGYLSPADDLSLDEKIVDDRLRDLLTRNGVLSVRDNETARKDLTINRGATISGHVVYSDGAPATQTLIFLEEVPAKPAASSPQNPGSDSEAIIAPASNAGSLLRAYILHQSQGTNDEGDFRVAGLRPGTYRVAAVLPSPGTSSSGEDSFSLEGFATADPKSLRVYGGDTLHKSAARTYELRAGEETSGIEITIPTDAFFRVAGHLTALDGRPIIVAALTLTDASDDSFVLHARPARDGSFIFPEVPIGTYSLAIAGARLGTLPDNSAPVEAAILQNPESFVDKTTTVLVKDSDIIDLSIQLESAKTATSQPTSSSPSQ